MGMDQSSHERRLPHTTLMPRFAWPVFLLVSVLAPPLDWCQSSRLRLPLLDTVVLLPVSLSELPRIGTYILKGSFQLCVTLGIWGVAMTNWGMSSYAGDVR